MAGWQILVLVLLVLVLIGGSVWASMDDGWLGWGWCGIPLVLIAGALVVMIPIWNSQQQAWEQWCRDQGGHVTDSTTTTTVVTVGANGQPGVGTGSSTTYYCLTADGRILDIRS